MAFLVDAYGEDIADGEPRTALRFHPRPARIKAAVFQLLTKAGAIGRRYRRQDEIGTPYGITIDHQTMQDDTVTLRERDSMQQVRLPIDRLVGELAQRLVVR